MMFQPLVNDPMGVVTALLVIEGAILLLSEHPGTKRFFTFLPSMFWIYSVPMILATVGLLPAEKDAAGADLTPTYGVIGKYCLPAALALLLVSVDIRAIFRLGRVALVVMLAGSLGIVLGGPAVYFVFKPWLPPEMWKGIGALSASWVGGSANLIAVANGNGTPDYMRSMIIVVDTIVPYVWMGILVALARRQGGYDRWNKSDRGIIEELKRRAEAVETVARRPATVEHTVLILMLAAAVAMAARKGGELLPVMPNLLSAGSWTIILATTLGVALSFTPARRLEAYGASRMGYALLYFVLASYGATASLLHLAQAPALVAAGFVWVGIHAAFTIVAARLLKAPLALAATASQANIGGVASAPAVAEIYQEGLAPVGLLLAVLGNIIGTYTGILCTKLCHLVS
jgi:uncharacterized membrane protein